MQATQQTIDKIRAKSPAIELGTQMGTGVDGSSAGHVYGCKHHAVTDRTHHNALITLTSLMQQPLL